MDIFGKKKNKEKDEYEEIYGQYKDAGFEFSYGGHIGKSKFMSQEQMSDIGFEKRNRDCMFVKCRKCGGYMNFDGTTEGLLDGWYVCPTCGTRMKEMTAYNQLVKENEEWEHENSFTEDEDLDCSYFED